MTFCVFFELLHTYARTLRCRQSLGVLVDSKLVSEKLSLRARFTIASVVITTVSSVFLFLYLQLIIITTHVRRAK